MSHRVRKPVLAGNWKMNKGPEDATSFFAAFADAYQPKAERTVIVFPPALTFAACVTATRERPDLELGVQNIHWEENGAFTGEISAAIASQAHARYVLAGHSERRHVFGETNEETGLKCAAALAAGLIPIGCVGETLEQRDAGQLRDVLLAQLDAILDAIPEDAGDRIVVAYEPVWAIGTGKNATPADAAEAHAIIRERLAERYGRKPASRIPILYGGSVKPDNAADLLAADGVDGLLVGGASLDPVAFARIAAA